MFCQKEKEETREVTHFEGRRKRQESRRFDEEPNGENALLTHRSVWLQCNAYFMINDEKRNLASAVIVADFLRFASNCNEALTSFTPLQGAEPAFYQIYCHVRVLT